MYIVIPIYSDINLHPLHIDNKLSLLYVKELGKDSFMLTFDHIDMLKEYSFDFLKDEDIITYSKKHLLSVYPFKNIYDIDMLHWWMYNKPLELDDIKIPAIDFLNNKYYNVKDINTIIPIYKHQEYYDEVSSRMESVWNKKCDSELYEKYNNEAILAFYSIERNGITVSDDVCDIFDERVEKHISDNKLYSDYFLYTSTGRPSNSYGNINFAAINKSKRTCFIPNNDLLFQFDYDAYHLRLIADLIGYVFPEGSAHEYLANFYGTTYDEGKKITFKLLYGGSDDVIRKNIPFFNKVQIFINDTWKEFNNRGYVETTIHHRKLFKHNHGCIDMNKLFNYLIQSYETERNIGVIIDIQKCLYGKKSKLILYEYDGFLFDFSKKDGVETLLELKDILECGGYLTRVKCGKSYGELNDIKWEL